MFLVDDGWHGCRDGNLSPSLLRYLRYFIVYFVSFFLIFQPFFSYAGGGIVVDGSAPGGQRAGLDSAQNGVPVVNIAAPSGSGVSHNKFTDFNVDSRGVIMNNSLVVGVSQLGGALPGNANFTGGRTARIILGEVTGAGRSNINGATEIFGDKAEYVLANPNGITCNGCGFINTPKVTLSTGVADISGGVLNGFNVTRGDVRFEGLDVSATNLDSFDIISRTASFAASVYAGSQLNVITGSNYVDYNSKAARPITGTGAAPLMGIDSSALGGMYAGKINLIATESGVGVNTQGKIGASAGDINITADGRIEFKDANAGSGNIKITSKSSSVKHGGNSYSSGTTEIAAAQSISLADGFTAAKASVKINSASLDASNTASVMAGVDAVTSGSDVSFTDNNLGILNITTSRTANNAGTISSSSITANTGDFNNTGLVQSSGDIAINAASVDNSNSYVTNAEGYLTGGILAARNIGITTISGGINNTSGAISGNALTLSSNGQINNDSGLVNSATTIDIDAVGISNNSGNIFASGDIKINAGLGDVSNISGAINSGGKITATTTGAITNSGRVQSVSDTNITAASITNINNLHTDNNGNLDKGILSGGKLDIAATGNITNTDGALYSADILTLASGSIITNSGLAASGSAINITGNSVSNSGSVTTKYDIALTATTEDVSNTGGEISGNNISITASQGNFNNSSGLSQSAGTTTINSQGLINDNTYSFDNTGTLTKGIISGADLTANIGNKGVSNNDGAIIGGGKVTITTSDNVTNSGLINALATLKITAARINNSNSYKLTNGSLVKGLIAKNTIDLTSLSDDIVNTNGAISGHGLTLSASGQIINNSLVQSSADITIKAASVDNSGSYVKDFSAGMLASGDITINSGVIDNSSGTIAGNNVAITSAASFINNSGLVQATGNATVSASSISNINTKIKDAGGTLIGGIIASGLLTLNAKYGDINNTGGVLSGGGDTVITATGYFINTGLVQSDKILAINAAGIDNSNSYIVTNGILSGGLIASGTITLNAGINDIINENGGISAGKTFSLSAYNIENNKGYISANGVTGTSLLIAANQINNQAGSILAQASLTISGASGNNTADGVISAKDKLNVTMSDGELANKGGDIYSDGGEITAQNVNNNGGRIQAANKIKIISTHPTFDNRDGTVLAFANGSIVDIAAAGNVLNAGGNIISILNTDITQGEAYNFTGNVTSGGHVDITAPGITNNYNIVMGDYITLTVTNGANFTNNSGASFVSGASFTLNMQGGGTINNYGEISAPVVTINGAGSTLNNYRSGTITSSGTLDIGNLAAINTINNNGHISAETTANIIASSLINDNAQIASNVTLTITTTGNLTNRNGALLYSTSHMFLHAGSIDNTNKTLNNSDGLAANIFSMHGNITLDKTSGVRNSYIHNTSGSIETMSGDITINTDSLTNDRSSYVSMATRPANMAAGYTDSNWSWLFSNYDEYYHDNEYYMHIFRVHGQNGALASILSGHDMLINANSLINYGTQINAGNDLTIHTPTANIKNTSEIAQEWAQFAAISGEIGVYHWFNSADPGQAQFFSDSNFKHFVKQTDGYSLWFSTTPLRPYTTRATISAGHDLLGNIADLKNQDIYIGGAQTGITSQSADTSATKTNLSISVTEVDNTQFAQNLTNTNSTTSAQETVVITANTLSPAQTQSSVSSPSALAISLIQLPIGNNGLFKINTAPGSNYLIETNLAFIDQSLFKGSDYFLSRIGYTPPSNQKLLGDAFYETKLVNQQIFERTGKKYIEQGISTDLAQMQKLMDNAVNEKTALNLSVGIELSATQITSLSSDIIWLVDQVIDGQHALVAVLYLAQATLDGVSGNGAVMSAGNDLTLNSSGSITNSGSITAGHNIRLVAGNDISNTGGLIKAGNDVTLVSTNGDIINQSLVNTASSAGNITSYLQAQGKITAGGNASLSAGNDIDVIASIITAAGSVDINAGNDVNIGIANLRNRTEIGVGTKHSSIDDITTHVSSAITAGDNLNITSFNSTIVQASKLDAGGNVDINAGNEVALLTTTDSAFHEKKDSKSNLVWQSSSDAGSYKETLSHVEITSGGNVNITGTGGVVVQYKDTGNLNDSIEQLSKAPELAWMANIKNQNNVQFQGVQEAYTSWDYKQQGLTGAGSAIIAIAVAIATAGAGAAAMGTMGFVAEGSAAAGGLAAGATVTAGAAAGATVVSASTMAAIGAATSALASQAAVSLTNNQGDIGKTLKELGTSETVKNMAFAALTAGATQYAGETLGYINPEVASNPAMYTTQAGTNSSINIMDQATSALTYTEQAEKILVNAGVNSAAQTAIYGGNLGTNFADSLKTGAVYAAGADVANVVGGMYNDGNGQVNEATHLAMHAAIGCAIGAGTSGNCGAGAIGAAAAEGFADLGLGADKQTNSQIGQYAALGTALITGADAKGIYTANGTAVNALENNYLSPKNRKIWEEKVDNQCGKGESSCRDNMDKQYKESTFAANEIIASGIMESYTFCDSLCGQMVFDTRMLPFVIIGGVLQQEASNLIDAIKIPGSLIKNGAYGIDENGNVILYDTETGMSVTDAGLDVSLFALGMTAKKIGGEETLTQSSNRYATELEEDFVSQDLNEYLLAGEGGGVDSELFGRGKSRKSQLVLLRRQLISQLKSQENSLLPLSKEDYYLLELIKDINPQRYVAGHEERYRNNCFNCVFATDHTLRGNPIGAMPALRGDAKEELGVRREVMEKLYGNTFEPFPKIYLITEHLLEKGPGTTGIVSGGRASKVTVKDMILGITRPNPGHVFNAINNNGKILYLDGQTGTIADTSPYVRFRFMELEPIRNIQGEKQ